MQQSWRISTSPPTRSRADPQCPQERTSMIQVAVATSSRTRKCTKCEKVIDDITVIIEGEGPKEKIDDSTSQLVLHPRCARALINMLDKVLPRSIASE